MTSALYQGTVVHARRDRWTRHAFAHRMYVASIDLDHLPAARLLSHDRFNLFALHDRDYRVAAAAPGAGLAAAARALIARAGLPRPARVELITQLRVLGVQFNPVSFFVGRDAAGAIETAVVEINNTYGGGRVHVLGPADRAPDGAFTFARTLYVSPFLTGAATYRLALADHGAAAPRLSIAMQVDRDDGAPFRVRLTGRRVALDDRALLAAALRHPLQPLAIWTAIHAHALRLHWRRVPARSPAPEDRA